jgi:hypothetical protein
MNEMLAMSDTSQRAHIDNAAKLTDDDRATIRNYCDASISLESLSSVDKQNAKALRAESAGARKRLETWMRANNVSCAVLPRASIASAENALAADGLSTQPPYVRITRNNCDRAITAEVVDGAFKSVTRADILEQTPESGEDALCEAVLAAVRRNVRSFKEQCSLSENIERGKKITNTPELPTNVAKDALQMHLCISRAKKASAKNKESMGSREEHIKKTQPAVENVLEKLCVNSQHVEVKGEPYRLVKRVSTTKTKMTLKIFSTFFKDVVRAEAGIISDKKAACALWESSRDTLLRAALMKIASLPASRSSKVLLQKVKKGSVIEDDDGDEINAESDDAGGGDDNDDGEEEE